MSDRWSCFFIPGATAVISNSIAMGEPLRYFGVHARETKKQVLL